jgi:hypothetical protein
MGSSSLFSSLSQDSHAALQEFVGTTFFLVLGLGGIQAATVENNTDAQGGASNIEQVMYTSTAMGFSLLVSAWLFFRVTGGLFNPNVSLALLLVGIIRPVRFVLFCLAQLLGAIAASALLMALTPGPLSVKFILPFEEYRPSLMFFYMSARLCSKERIPPRAFLSRCSSRLRSFSQCSCWPPKNTMLRLLRRYIILLLLVYFMYDV